MLLAEVDIDESIQNTFDTIGDWVPKIVATLIIFLIGWFIARIIQRVLIRLLKAIKFDRVLDKSGLGGPIERAGYADSGVLLAKIIYYMIMLIVLQLTISVFGDSPIQESFDDLVAAIPKIIIGIIIIILTGVVANVVKEIVRPAVDHLTYDNFIVGVVTAVIWFIGIFAALDHVGVAQNVVNTLFQGFVYGLFLILVIKFGVGGIWSARDRFWPAVYDKFAEDAADAPSSPPQSS